jgi:hypothetical protein
MRHDGEVTTLCLTHFMSGSDHRMRCRFGFCLGIKAAEGETQRTGGVARADIHRF